MRPILVGIDAPDGTYPLDPNYTSGRLLAELSGLTPTQFQASFDCVNLHAGPSVDAPQLGSGASQPSPRQRDGYARLNIRQLLRGRRVVALGRRVADSLSTPDEWMRWGLCDGFVGASLPHPSGLNRWWNNSTNRKSAGDFMKSLLKPCIHVEGVDGSGKTTLVERMRELTDLRVVPTTNPPKSFSECLTRIERRVRPGIVSDRSSGLISELVYGPVLRDGCCGDEDVLWRIVDSVSYAVVFVYCCPTLMSPTHREEEDFQHRQAVMDNLGKLSERYDVVMSRLIKRGVQVISFDYETQRVEDLVSCVVR